MNSYYEYLDSKLVFLYLCVVCGRRASDEKFSIYCKASGRGLCNDCPCGGDVMKEITYGIDREKEEEFLNSIPYGFGCSEE